jgi:alpha-L-arabinofuranosidase
MHVRAAMVLERSSAAPRFRRAARAVTRVTVDPARSLGTLSPHVFGGFVEHLGRCIYGGLFDEGSPLSDERGFRRDVLELLEQLRVSVLRWPGGNFVSNYHWTDGIGPVDERPRRVELAWGAEESNRFGTDEFVEYCRVLGAEPYVCLNMGTGTLEEALAWVEYCNSSGATAWASRRRENGHDEPHGVRWWALGNEMYGAWQVGALSAQEYVAEATRWARAIRMLDPGVKLVSCGLSGVDEWDRVVVDGLSSLVDLHSIHIYTGSSDYWTNVLQPHQAERAIRGARALIEHAAYLQRIPEPPRLAYDEWNVWYRNHDSTLEERYDLSDALAVGTYLNIFVRNCEWVRMANLAQLVNAIAPIVTTPERATVQPIYYPLLLHAGAALDEAVDLWVDGAAVEQPGGLDDSRWPHRIDDLGPFDLVDAAATVDSERTRLAVTLVNRSTADERVELVVRDRLLEGEAAIRIVTGETDAAGREIPDVETAQLEEVTEQTAGSTLGVVLPASSFTCVEVQMASV